MILLQRRGLLQRGTESATRSHWQSSSLRLEPRLSPDDWQAYACRYYKVALGPTTVGSLTLGRGAAKNQPHRSPALVGRGKPHREKDSNDAPQPKSTKTEGKSPCAPKRGSLWSSASTERQRVALGRNDQSRPRNRPRYTVIKFAVSLYWTGDQKKTLCDELSLRASGGVR